MEKKTYIVPQTTVCLIQGQVLLNTISDLHSTNTKGLGISDEDYEDEGRTKDAGVWGLWDEE